MFLKMLEKERDKRGWTQEDVAKKIGVSRSAYANYEKGKRKPDFDISQRLADLFETTIDYLLGGDGKESSIEETEIERVIRETNEILKSAKNVEQVQLMLDLAKNVFKK